MDISKIKLIIWDLDETLWTGVLSDGSAKFMETNAQLIKNITDCGVINSICSKNNFEQVKNYLIQQNLWDYFVFQSINWSPKGERVKQIISEMNLRDANVLFIDDNNLNLQEVKNVCSNISIASPDIIPTLAEYFESAEKKDSTHSRLKQYKVLEAKKEFKAKTCSNEDFLYKCNIRVTIKHDCSNQIERIHDLVQRSNQLNFTKVRSSIQELIELFEDNTVTTGYVEVEDNFGDYGIVGFYAIKDGICIHFVFSCRTLNMGIEQYVYNNLGKPYLTVVGDVASSLNDKTPEWINQKRGNKSHQKKHTIKKSKILFKGPCDLELVFSFIENSPNIIKEFVYVGKNGVSIESSGHTTHIVEHRKLESDIKNRLINDLPFGDANMFTTSLFDDDISVIYLSMFTDPNLGLYREKDSGAIVAFGEWTNDLTNESLWQDFINQKLFTANCKFTKSSLEYIRDHYNFIGRISPEESLKNLEYIYSNIKGSTKLILNLGSEIEHIANTQEAYKDRHLYHRRLNNLIREWKKNKPNVYLIETSNYIQSQEYYTNNINHFVKSVYHDIAKNIIDIISDKKIKVRRKQKPDIFRKIDKLYHTILNRLK